MLTNPAAPLFFLTKPALPRTMGLTPNLTTRGMSWTDTHYYHTKVVFRTIIEARPSLRVNILRTGSHSTMEHMVTRTMTRVTVTLRMTTHLFFHMNENQPSSAALAQTSHRTMLLSLWRSSQHLVMRLAMRESCSAQPIDTTFSEDERGVIFLTGYLNQTRRTRTLMTHPWNDSQQTENRFWHV